MHIYFSGIGGVAIGPLARIAKDLGYEVTGSDQEQNRYTDSIVADEITVEIGQTYEKIANLHSHKPIDWFVHTAGLPIDHPELKFAQENNIKSSKRDAFINEFLGEKNLKLIAVAGTHGKTNTTGMLVWVFKQLGIPISYSVGTNINYGPNGKYDPSSKYFLYEADEFDRNFLKFHPLWSIFTAVDYDHPETYPTVEEYKRAFHDFAEQSESLITWKSISDYIGLPDDFTRHIIPDFYDGALPERDIKLMGEYTRKNAYLALALVKAVMPEVDREKVMEAINSFPGTERRMEKLAEDLYSDYAHHPIEIRAAIQNAKELGKPIVVVYQPHQNVRQHQIKDVYKDVFMSAEKVYWLPTYLSRENKKLPILTPDDLVVRLSDPAIAEVADMNDSLKMHVDQHRQDGNLVLLLSAGDLDEWSRSHLV